MNLKNAQQVVDAWISQFGYWEPLANLARLVEEVGELSRAINLHHGPKPAKPGEGADVGEELGDVLFSVITLANQLEIDLSDALQATLEKYDVRDIERHLNNSNAS